jgi:hypothetical protein
MTGAQRGVCVAAELPAGRDGGTATMPGWQTDCDVLTWADRTVTCRHAEHEQRSCSVFSAVPRVAGERPG